MLADAMIPSPFSRVGGVDQDGRPKHAARIGAYRLTLEHLQKTDIVSISNAYQPSPAVVGVGWMPETAPPRPPRASPPADRP